MTKYFLGTRTMAISIAVLAFACAATAVLLSAVNAADEKADKAKSETDKILALDKMWAEKVQAGDVQWISNVLADNTIQFPPDAPMIMGKEAVTAAWKSMIDTEGLEVSWQVTAAHVSASNDMAYTYGTAKVKNPDGSVVNSKYVTVWTNVNGEWKAVADIYNSDGPATK